MKFAYAVEIHVATEGIADSALRRACRTTYEGLHTGSVTRMVSEQLFGLS